MELPFQWDDGNFISPFVASSEEYLIQVSRWFLEHLLLPRLEAYASACAGSGTHTTVTSSPGTPPSVTLHFRLADLGCGEGSALFFLSQHLSAAWETCVEAAAKKEQDSGGEAMTSSTACGDACEEDAFVPVVASASLREVLRRTQLQIHALGVDLDDVLIDQARDTCKMTPSNTQSCVIDYNFICGDIRSCDLDSLFPRSAAEVNTTAEMAKVHVHAQSALYLYLLPEGLEVMKAQILNIADPRGWLILSNRWPVPYLLEACGGKPTAVVDSVSIYEYPRAQNEC